MWRGVFSWFFLRKEKVVSGLAAIILAFHQHFHLHNSCTDTHAYPWPNEMSTRDNQSYAVTSTRAGEAERLFSKAIRDTEADRKAEAKKVSKRFYIYMFFFSPCFFFFDRIDGVVTSPYARYRARVNSHACVRLNRGGFMSTRNRFHVTRNATR